MQIFLKWHNEIKHNHFIVAGKFILIDYLEKNSGMNKEKKKAGRIKCWVSESCRLFKYLYLEESLK